jgi:hypothetical protein
VVITRNRSGEDTNFRQLHGDGQLCAQTNIDHGPEPPEFNIFYSLERRRAVELWAQHLATAAPARPPRYRDFWQLLQTDPIRNELTVYSVLMCPALQVFEVRLPTYTLAPEADY